MAIEALSTTTATSTAERDNGGTQEKKLKENE